jgi:PST family polysaccharide transporter
MKGSLGKRVVHSSAWIYARVLVTSLFNLFVVAILARKLHPAEFGLVALASVILQFLTTLGPAGIGDFVVYDRKEGWQERVHAAFWLNIALTLAATGVCAALVPLVSLFYHMAGLRLILYAFLARFALGQLGVVPDALLRRELNFKALSLREMALATIAGAGMVAMALGGCGVWSLVLPTVVVTPVSVWIAFRLAKWSPSLPLRRTMWPGICRYSFHTMGAAFVTLVGNEGDTLLIGKRLGATELGFYNQAWTSANVVNRNVTGVVSKVAMPALSTVSQDMARLRAALNSMMRLLALASFPLLVGMFMVADLFVLTIYGPKWEPSVLPLRILIVYAMRQTIGSPAGVVFNVLGRPDVAFKLGLLFLPLYCLSIWVGSCYGIVGVAAGVTLARTSFGFVTFYVISRLLNDKYRNILLPLVRPLLAALAMGFSVLVFRFFLERSGLSAWALLVTLALCGVVVWLLLLARCFPELLQETLQVCDLLSIGFGRRLRVIIRPICPGASIPL